MIIHRRRKRKSLKNIKEEKEHWNEDEVMKREWVNGIEKKKEKKKNGGIVSEKIVSTLVTKCYNQELAIPVHFRWKFNIKDSRY